MKKTWVIFLAAAVAAVGLSGDGLAASSPGALTEVVVTVKGSQDTVVRAVRATLPDARIRWRYHLVLDGFAVVLPQSELAALGHVPGIAEVWPSVTYHRASGVTQIGAPALWGPTLATAGQGEKIGIIDDGLDADHPYFDPTGFSYPAGFPKGQTQYTTAKVIVQRAFPAPGQTWKYADTPFDPVNSFHATHVAGIAAGDHNVNAKGAILSGVAPDAYIGNYKVYTVPTPNFGLDGDSAEIAAGIEAAVADGMNVINLSIGEPEIEPSRDLVDLALEGAARAGVVPVVAAGNDGTMFGPGSVNSPGTTADAITVGAVDARGVVAGFSSIGPTPVSLQLKPDVVAPGVGILSSVPPRQGTWETLDGTSMAAPHVSGAAALLLQRHPGWTVAQVKSALVLTGDPAHGATGEAPTTREGGGVIDLPRADNPLVFASPSSVSFGRVLAGTSASQSVSLTDAGGGAGTWNASVVLQSPAAAGTVAAPVTVEVPGTLALTATAGSQTADVTGFVVLTHGADTRRIPFWFLSSAAQLGTEARPFVRRPGVYRGTTKGGPSKISSYRYPAAGRFPGPERAYRIRVGRVANFGVVVLSGKVTAHITFDGAEDHLAGYTTLPLNFNPFGKLYGDQVPASGVVRPAPGVYDIVFDTRSAAAAGPFSFRLWVNDTKPPKLRIGSLHGGISVVASDAGSGVDPASIEATLAGHVVPVRFADGVIHITAPRGRYKLVLSVADYQETKNNEDVPAVLPNTATLRATVRVR